MALGDAEIQILIKAVDQASETLKRIEGNLSKAETAIYKSTEKATGSLNNQLGTLLALGNVAQKTDAIFSAYQNMQLRVENAVLRVTNAQERLEDVQTRLNRLVRDGKTGTDEYQDAQTDLERATRGLQISQNNLQRTQNQVLGTWINMGVQSVTLVADLIKISQALKGTAVAAALVNAFTNPAVLALGAVAAVAAIAVIDSATGTQDFAMSSKNLASTLPATTTRVQEYATATQNVAKGYQAINNEIATTIKLGPALGELGTAILGIPGIPAGTKGPFADMTITDVTPKIGGGNNVTSSGPRVTTGKSWDGKNITITTYPKQNDFMMRGNSIVPFSSEDTIVGFKGQKGLGMTINIGNIYGLDARDVSRALNEELYNKISL